MDHTMYPAHVQEWIGIVEKSITGDSERLMECCDKIYEYAEAVNSNYLRGFSLFFKGFWYYSETMLEDSMRTLSAALNYLVSEDAWYMTARTYNSMGNIADFQGDLSLATDCYCKGLQISKEHDFGILSFSISSNIANVHISLGQVEHAIEMLHYCEQLLGEGVKVPDIARIVVLSNLTTCYVRLGDLERGKDYLDRLIQTCGDRMAEQNLVTVYIIQSELYHALGDAEKRDAAIADLDNLKLHSTSILDALSELCRHAMLLLELDKIPEFLNLTKQIERCADGAGIQKKVLELQLKYYKKIGDTKMCEETAVKYYESVEQCEGMRNKIISHNISIRLHLDEEAAKRKEEERTNLLLKRKSESDALTGMNNRYKLNELTELAFHRAYTNGTPIAMEILDIDYYKQFNDNYGHQAGDECLIKIADAIRSMEEYPNVFTARYGGDEFVVIYEDYTIEEVEKMARMLRSKIRDLNIEHRYSKISDRITISQGLFHRIPAGSNKPWDFLHCADMVLYGVKNRSRDSFYIATSLAEASEYSKKA